MNMSMSSGGFSKLIGLLLVGVFGLIGVNIVAQPLAEAVVKAGAVSDAAYLATFLKFLPFLFIVSIVAGMFAAGGGISMGSTQDPASNLMKAIILIVGAVMLPILITQMTAVNTTYALAICAASGTQGSDALYISTVGTACTGAGKFTAVVTFTGIVGLGYVLALVNLMVPSLKGKAFGYARGRFGM